LEQGLKLEPHHFLGHMIVQLEHGIMGLAKDCFSIYGSMVRQKHEVHLLCLAQGSQGQEDAMVVMLQER
jgi:hypothetical protein